MKKTEVVVIIVDHVTVASQYGPRDTLRPRGIYHSLTPRWNDAKCNPDARGTYAVEKSLAELFARPCKNCFR